MKRFTLIFCLILLSGCSLPSTPTPPPTAIPPAGICAYQWAYQDLPDINTQLDPAIKSLDPSASAHATAFGEECILTQDLRDFLAIETDFYILKPVSDLTDFESFGNWIGESMAVIESLPDDQIIGPHSGFVEFTFSKDESNRLIVRVPIQDYRDKSSGKSGEELFRLFYQPPQ